MQAGITDPCIVGTELLTLLEKPRRVALRGERDYAKALRMSTQYIQRAFTNAAGRTQHRDANHGIPLPNNSMPSIRHGAAASRLSKRSKTPPWPRISVPLSLKPANLLHRLSS